MQSGALEFMTIEVLDLSCSSIGFGDQREKIEIYVGIRISSSQIKLLNPGFLGVIEIVSFL